MNYTLMNVSFRVRFRFRIHQESHALTWQKLFPHCQGTLFRTCISNTRVDVLTRHRYKFLYPKDTLFCARISNTRGDHIGQHSHKPLDQDILFWSRISNTRADHVRQPKNKSLHPKDIRFRVRISNTRGDLVGGTLTSLCVPRTSVLWRISNTRGDHFRQLYDTSLHPMDIQRFRAKM